MSNNSIEDIANMMAKVKEMSRDFSEDNFASHLNTISRHKNTLTQACTSELSQLKLDRIEHNYNSLKNDYHNFEKSNSLEATFEIFKKLDQLHHDVLRLQEEVSEE